jgi:hypothetical protein
VISAWYNRIVRNALLATSIVFTLLIIITSIINIVDVALFATKKSTSVLTTSYATDGVQNCVFLVAVVITTIIIFELGIRVNVELKNFEQNTITRTTAITITSLLFICGLTSIVMAISLILLLFAALTKYALIASVILNMINILVFIICLLITFGPLTTIMNKVDHKSSNPAAVAAEIVESQVDVSDNE